MAHDAPPIIGPSNGWLSAKISPQLNVHQRILNESGATAVELFMRDKERMQILLDGHLELEAFPYRSLHLWDFATFEENDTAEQLAITENIARICSQYRIHTAVIHPDATPPIVFELLSQHRVPFAIENMDRLKSFGTTVGDVESTMRKTGSGGILDLQHCFEIALDSYMPMNTLVHTFATMMRRNGGIKQLHVSGEISEHGRQTVSHAPLTVATNTQSILEGLAVVRSTLGKLPPIILEGDYLAGKSFLSPENTLSDSEQETRISSTIRAVREEIEIISRFIAKLP